MDDINNLNLSTQTSLILSAVKSADKSFATINDVITYTIIIQNTSPTDALNLLVTDLIPQGANFVNNTLTVNGILMPGIDPAFGINLQTLPALTTTTITMNALVVTLPYTESLSNLAQLDYQYVDLSTTPNLVNMSIDSNSAVTTIQAALTSLSKTVAESSLTGAGQILNYTLTVSNNGNVDINNLIVIDTIPTGTTFIPNTVRILGITVPGTVVPPSGFSFGNLPANSYSEIAFSVQVTSVPANEQIINQGLMTYDYVLSNISPVTIQDSAISNIVTLQSNIADLSQLKKYTDKNYATFNEPITYTIVIPNTGQLDAINVTVVDTIPNDTSYISNSLTINGVISPQQPPIINIGTIAAGTTLTLSFKIKVI